MSKARRARAPHSTHASPGWGDGRWIFRLYIAGWDLRYQTAYQNLKRLCEEHSLGKYEIDVVDLDQTPERASADNVIAIPTVMKVSPEPVIRIVGDLSDTKKVLDVFGLPPR